MDSAIRREPRVLSRTFLSCHGVFGRPPQGGRIKDDSKFNDIHRSSFTDTGRKILFFRRQEESCRVKQSERARRQIRVVLIVVFVHAV